MCTGALVSRKAQRARIPRVAHAELSREGMAAYGNPASAVIGVSGIAVRPATGHPHRRSCSLPHELRERVGLCFGRLLMVRRRQDATARQLGAE
jgi:hypothetical protein